MTRRSRRRALSLTAAVCLASSLVVPPGVAHADPRPATIEAWQQSTSARLDADGSLSDVLALSAGDIWAVGQQAIWDVWKNRGTIRHWNGKAWGEVAIRDSTGAGNLRSVAAAAPGEVWALGDGHDGLPYLAKGDLAGFDRVQVPGLWSGDWLGGLDARGGKVVAVGRRDKTGLIVTGQGNSWTVQKTKEKGALYAVSSGFAVGDTGEQPLIVRQSGGSWKAMPVPSVPGGYLRDIQVDNAKRALAVGGVYHGPGSVEPLVLSWNGKKWTREKLPAIEARLYGVTGDGKGRYWIAGYDAARPTEGFLMRQGKDGFQVIRGGGTLKGRDAVRLQAVTYLPGKGTVWAVGHVVDATDRYTDVVETFGLKTPTQS
ncbi:hypothetical protein [Nonomuraea endophytica]|uniref:Uncharacterized protein n=1 Tax=Nonomuraea endophytica TaxID=714136 RepID=A0A7W8AAJ9_9ACTN|nr:hypothetical protein [Nonomuraea endophytica]MBB5082597.1 hypothetical protein [Nonomuraea endophytica]